jgi:hypothetical protein
VVELAYLGSSGGEWGLKLSDLAMDQIVHGYHLNPALQASGIGGSHHNPDHVHFGNGADVPGHRSEGRSHSTGQWLQLLNLQSSFGHSLPGCIVTYPIASGKGKEGAGWIQNQMEARAAELRTAC